MTFPHGRSHENKQTNKNQIKPNQLPGKRKIVWVKISACLIPQCGSPFQGMEMLHCGGL